MGFSFNILFLGWLLTGHKHMSRGQNYPKPSISVIPGEVVALGGHATIHCKSEGYQRVEFRLHKEGSASLQLLSTKVAETEEVVFPIVNAQQSDEGTYRCIYSFKSDRGPLWSDYSDKVHISITDVPKQAEPTAVPKTMTIISASCATGLLLLVLLLLLLAFLLYRKRRKSSTGNERKKPVNTPLEPESGADLDEVSYAVLNHHSLKTKQAASPDRVPQSCVYASLAKHRTREDQ